MSTDSAISKWSQFGRKSTKKRQTYQKSNSKPFFIPTLKVIKDQSKLEATPSLKPVMNCLAKFADSSEIVTRTLHKCCSRKTREKSAKSITCNSERYLDSCKWA